MGSRRWQDSSVVHYHLASSDLVLHLVGEGDVHPGSFKGRVLDALSPGSRDSVQAHAELEIVAGTLQRRFHSLDVGIQVIAPNPQRFEAQLLHRLFFGDVSAHTVPALALLGVEQNRPVASALRGTRMRGALAPQIWFPAATALRQKTQSLFL